MLCLTLHYEEPVTIGGVMVRVFEVRDNVAQIEVNGRAMLRLIGLNRKVRMLVDAPKDVAVCRESAKNKEPKETAQ